MTAAVSRANSLGYLLFKNINKQETNNTEKEKETDKEISNKEIFRNESLFNNEETTKKIKCQICSSCSSENIVLDQQTSCLICEDCGIIYDTICADKDYYNYYNSAGYSSASMQRCNTIINKYLPKTSINTTLYKGGYNKKYMARQFYYWNDIPYKEKSIADVFKKIKHNCHISLPEKIIADAKDIYFKSSMKITRGKNRIGLIMACVFMACKQNNVPRTEKEIADIFELDHKLITRGYNKLIKILNEKGHTDVIDESDKASNPDDYIPRFCSNLGIIDNPEFEKQIVDVINIANENGLTDNNAASSIAAGAILFMAKHVGIKGITKKKIETKCGLSSVTITKCFRQFQNNKDVLLSE